MTEQEDGCGCLMGVFVIAVALTVTAAICVKLFTVIAF